LAQSFENIVKSALVFAASGGAQILFGRPLLERTLIHCERAGIARFLIVCPPAQRGSLGASLGRFDGDPRVRIEDRPQQLLEGPTAVEPSEACLAVGADVVLARSQLDGLLREHRETPGEIARFGFVDGGRGSILAIGPLRDLVKLYGTGEPAAAAALNGALPYGPEARDHAEVSMARALRFETTGTDGMMARLFDRKLSWRISYRLARTAVTPNQITIANTFFGLVAAWMFASPSYWWRLMGSMLFLLSVTIDGVDGEVARLKMVESAFGKRLDVFTDNVVNIAILIAVGIGCYRTSGSTAYMYLLPLFIGGFVFCVVAVQRALRVSGAQADRWIGKVERICGRDFAYLLAGLAIVNRLNYAAWGTAFGTYVFAIVLWWLTGNQAELRDGKPHSEPVSQRRDHEEKAEDSPRSTYNHSLGRNAP